MAKILVIDDDQALSRSLELQLSHYGHQVRTASTGSEGIAAAEAFSPEIVLVDLKLPDTSGLSVLDRLVEILPNCLVVMITGHQDATATVEAIRRGAFDYLRKPLDLNNLRLLLEKALRRLSARPRPALKLDGIEDIPEREIVGADPAVLEVLKTIARLSRNRVPVLIEGESGTGKELVARKLHEASTPNEPFVAVNCSAVVPTLFESELFGHEKGAFTGAETRKIGKLERAGSGTIFFDEIGDMPLELQAKLLRALQEREFERVGGNEPIALRARVMAATNRPLQQLVEAGSFRADLAYRLTVTRIYLPPLRERKADIPLLASHLVRRISRELHRPIEAVEEEGLKLLAQYEWPGNVRELENVLTRAVLLCRGNVLSEDEIRSALGRPTPTPAGKVPTLREAERSCVEKALAAAYWNITQAARMLEISPTTLRKKIRDFNLRNPFTGGR